MSKSQEEFNKVNTQSDALLWAQKRNFEVYKLKGMIATLRQAADDPDFCYVVFFFDEAVIALSHAQKRIAEINTFKKHQERMCDYHSPTH